MLQNIFLATQFLKIQYLCGKLKSSEDEWKLLDKIVIPGSTVVDIGSNIGRYTLKLSSITGPNGIVVAIEPNNHIFKIANSIQQIHKLKNIVQINACVSDKCHIAEFFEDWSAPSGVIFSTATRSRLLETFSSSQLVVAEGSKEDLKINKKLCITIDSLNIKPSLIKIDIEGSEIEAIKGGLSTISKYKPLLIIEDNQSNFSFLIELGYKIYKLPNSRNKIFSHINDNRNSIIKNLISKF